MNKIQIEHWALRVLDQIQAGQPNEDSTVELKRIWVPNHWETARQLAGHANAARGHPILWLVGVDQHDGVVGASHEELANWYNQVRSHFDERLTPEMQDVNMSLNGKTIAALLFETDRAPYVVRNQRGGPVQYEVPWREGTSTRSATRADLIRLLVPLQRRPDLEVLNGKLEMYRNEKQQWTTWSLDLRIYVIPRSSDRLTIPFHYCQSRLTIANYVDTLPGSELRLQPLYEFTGFRERTEPPPRTLSDTIRGTASEVHIDGPGEMRVTAFWKISTLVEPSPDDFANLTLRLQPVHSDYALAQNVTLRPMAPEQPDGTWTWRTAL